MVKTVSQPPATLPTDPVVLRASSEFRPDPAGGGDLVPVIVIEGQGLVAPASSASSSRLVVQFSQQGKSFDAEVVEPVTDIGGGVQRIVVKVPQSVIAGVADISLVRVDTVYGLDTCTGSYTTVEQPSASNRFRIGAVGNYVVAALRGAGQLAVMTQGDPFAASPASEIDIVARIPVGQVPKRMNTLVMR